jgi:hypothetical protein
MAFHRIFAKMFEIIFFKFNYLIKLQLWITLADHYVTSIQLNWPETCRMAFSDRVTVDDDKLGVQIVKVACEALRVSSLSAQDVHRTGWSGRGGGAHEQQCLKRVLLGYARYNAKVGYCQGFNVIGSILLHVVDYHETDALKVRASTTTTTFIPPGAHLSARRCPT